MIRQRKGEGWKLVDKTDMNFNSGIIKSRMRFSRKAIFIKKTIRIKILMVF